MSNDLEADVNSFAGGLKETEPPPGQGSTFPKEREQGREPCGSLAGGSASAGSGPLRRTAAPSRVAALHGTF